MASRPQPEQQAPPVQRLRIRYAKRGRARFTSHRDFSRAFERALRRAGVPMAYSSGFSPHPRISYANASPTGAASEAEYLEIGLAQACDPDAVRDALDAALPDGLDIMEVVPAPPGALADLLTGSRWHVSLDPAAQAELPAAIAAFLAAEIGGGPADDQERDARLRHAQRRSASRAGAAGAGGPGVDHDAVASGSARPPGRRAARSRVGRRPEFQPAGVPVLTRLTQGRLESETAAITEPGRVRISGLKLSSTGNSGRPVGY